MTKLKAYIAGSHVFWPKHEQEEFYNTIKFLSEKYSFEALVPKDGDIVADSKAKLAMLIYHKNIEMIKEADLVIADITSFRGVSADAGTIYEIGYARALNKTVVMWTADNVLCPSLKKASRSHYVPLEYIARVNLMDYNTYGFSVENFGLVDNLMITRPFDLVHCSIDGAFEAAWNLFNFKGGYDDNI